MYMSAKILVSECSEAEYARCLQDLKPNHHDPISFLQAPLYGRLQQQDGKQVLYFSALIGETVLACGIAIRYTAPGGLNFLYCPYGPVVSVWSKELLQALKVFFKSVAVQQKCAFVRLDSSELSTALGNTPLSNALARTASLQPRAEWLLDITPPEATIWEGFHKHVRYNVRLAERAAAETKVFAPSQAPLDDFFALMQTTASRDGFSIFNREYYAAYFKTLGSQEGFVVITYIKNQPVAAALFVVYDRQVHYVFAGSSNEHRKIAPAISVIWAAIKEAQKRGCTLFNFGGISDDVKGHSLAGVTSFKKRFGGYAVAHPNPIDLVYKPLHYTAFRLYKSFR